MGAFSAAFSGAVSLAVAVTQYRAGGSDVWPWAAAFWAFATAAAEWRVMRAERRRSRSWR